MDTNIEASIKIFIKFINNEPEEEIRKLIRKLEGFEQEDLLIELQVLSELIKKVQQKDHNSN